MHSCKNLSSYIKMKLNAFADIIKTDFHFCVIKISVYSWRWPLTPEESYYSSNEDFIDSTWFYLQIILKDHQLEFCCSWVFIRCCGLIFFWSSLHQASYLFYRVLDLFTLYVYMFVDIDIVHSLYVVLGLLVEIVYICYVCHITTFVYCGVANKVHVTDISVSSETYICSKIQVNRLWP